MPPRLPGIRVHQLVLRAALRGPAEASTRCALARQRDLRTLGIGSDLFALQTSAPASALIGGADGRTARRFEGAVGDDVWVLQACGQPPRGFDPGGGRFLATAAACEPDEGLAALRVWLVALGARVCAALCESPAQADLARALGVPAFLSAPAFDLERLSHPWRSPSLARPPEVLVDGGAPEDPEAPGVRDAMLRVARDALGRDFVWDTLKPSPRGPGARASEVLVWLGGGAAGLLRALAAGVPVVHLPGALPAHVLGEARIEAADPTEAGRAVAAVLRDPSPRRAVEAKAHAQLRALERTGRDALAAALSSLGIASHTDAPIPAAETRSPAIQIQGSFESSYSLDIVNRELALALERATPGEVALFPTHGHGDYRPRETALDGRPALRGLLRRFPRTAPPEVAIRGMYPPRVSDLRGGLRLFHFAWEESSLPAGWAERFNRRLDGLLVTSCFVRDVLRDAGVRVPIFVVGNGADQILRAQREPYPGPLGRGFTFLHVSSAFPRKGIDALLAAYGRAFSARDAVTLLLKTFPNIHHDVERDVAAARAARPDAPEIVLINRDLPEGQLRDLYERCDALVAPSRGEGFGLPLAEAMFFGKPVITTARGGQSDFCSEETAWLIDYRFAPAGSHFAQSQPQAESVWVEPDAADLARRLREVAGAGREALTPRIEAARALAQRELTWDAVAKRTRAAIAALRERSPTPALARPGVAWVGSWNARCGIASHSAYLLEHLRREFDVRLFASHKEEPVGAEGPEVIRCYGDWEDEDLSALETAICGSGCQVAVIQFNFGFFPLQPLGALLRRLRQRGIGRVLILHATQDRPGHSPLGSIASELGRADRLLVHGIEDLNALKGIGLADNVALFPHGVVPVAEGDPAALAAARGLAGRRVIASYGFLRAHKGLVELVRAMPGLLKREPNTRLLLVNARYPSADSRETRHEVQQAVAELRLGRAVELVDDYLEDAASMRLLQAAELIVFPYQQSLESSSAAVRLGLSSLRPVACTDLDIFSSVGDVVHLLAGRRPADLARDLARLLADRDLLARHSARQRAWVDAHRWDTVAARLGGLLASLACEAPASSTLSPAA